MLLVSSPIRRQYQLFIERPPEAVFAFVADLSNYARICPEDQKEEATGLAQGVGALVLFRGGPWGDITATVSEHDEPRLLSFQQVEGPFVSWTHRYKFSVYPNGTLLNEQFEYTLKGLAIAKEKLPSTAKLWDDWVRHRQSETKRILERIGRIKGPGV
jgi:ligand-binding SRPBCC domain-containing protein